MLQSYQIMSIFYLLCHPPVALTPDPSFLSHLAAPYLSERRSRFFSSRKAASKFWLHPVTSLHITLYYYYMLSHRTAIIHLLFQLDYEFLWRSEKLSFLAQCPLHEVLSTYQRMNVLTCAIPHEIDSYLPPLLSKFRPALLPLSSYILPPLVYQPS